MPTTFIYVFAGNKASKHNQEYYGKDEPQTLDEKLIAALVKLQNETAGEIRVVFNPDDYDRIRKIFEISKLPAFGISDIDLESTENRFIDRPPELPSRFNPFKAGKRKRMLKEAKYFPKVERNILDHLSDREKIFFFIRDLYFTSKDENLNTVGKVIYKKANEIFGKKATSIISEVKKKFIG